MMQRAASMHRVEEEMNLVAVHGAGNGRHGGGSAEPVFVLCMGRSGSTLLRLILDTHPDLACPPETGIPALCSQLAVVWSLIEGAPLSPQRGDAPPAIPDAAIAGIRQTMDLMTGPYLKRRGKKTYCDKSLGTARFAELLIRIYPATRFICLYRHPMDVISSGLEACPWGLNGYGFDPYIATSPGNAVMALARYWHDQANEIAAVEDNHPARCHRVRYEDMVADPEQVAAGVFAFLGAGPVPGIAQAVFSHDHERFGPADHKIWHTDHIGASSVGRSDAVPAGLIPPPVLESINGLLGKLGYATVDETWGTADMPAGLLAPAGDDTSPALPAAGTAVHLTETTVIAGRLTAGVTGIGDGFAQRWQARVAEAFTVVIRQPGDTSPVRWHVSPATRTLTEEPAPAAIGPRDRDSNGGDPGGVGQDADWSIVATAHAWQEVITGRVNLSTALRRGEIRYCDYGANDIFVTEARIALLAELLGLPAMPAGTPASGKTPAPAATR
jgi:Sulfotransferase family